jgi:hypothetical protein
MANTVIKITTVLQNAVLANNKARDVITVKNGNLENVFILPPLALNIITEIVLTKLS